MLNMYWGWWKLNAIPELTQISPHMGGDCSLIWAVWKWRLALVSGPGPGIHCLHMHIIPGNLGLWILFVHGRDMYVYVMLRIPLYSYCNGGLLSVTSTLRSTFLTSDLHVPPAFIYICLGRWSLVSTGTPERWLILDARRCPTALLLNRERTLFTDTTASHKQHIMWLLEVTAGSRTCYKCDVYCHYDITDTSAR